MLSIKGSLRFPYTLICDEDVAGAVVPITLAGFNGTVKFPNLPPPSDQQKQNKDRPLQAPDGWDIETPEPIQWGNQGPHSCNISYAMAVFKIRGKGKRAAVSAGNRIMFAYREWARLFNDLLESGHHYHSSFLKKGSFAKLELYGRDHAGNQFKAWFTNGRKGRIASIAFVGGTGLHLRNIRKGFKRASAGERPLLEHLLLRDAYKYVNKPDYRRCVLDAATATEVAFTNAAVLKLRSKLRPKEAEGIIDLIRGLRRKKDLAISLKLLRLDAKLSTSFEILNKARNDAIHAGKEISYETASAAHSAALRIVTRLRPRLYGP